METQIGAAMKAAGLKESREALRDLALAAMRDNPGELETARAEFLIEAAKADLLLVLFQPWLKAATNDYLSAAGAKLAAEKRVGGHKVRAEKAIDSVPLTRLPIPEGGDTRGHEGPTEKAKQQTPRASNSTESAHKADDGGGQLARAEKAEKPPPPPSAASLVRKSEAANLLMEFKKIDGKPLSLITGGRARTWAREHKRDGRFVELIAAGVPDNSSIGAFITPSDAARLWAQAQAETTNV